jgi:alkylated DNA repair dioxygenase AlkB
MADVDAAYVPALLGPHESEQALSELRARARWRCEQLRLFGRDVAAPRLVDWAGDDGLCYRYSHVDHWCAGWPAALARLRDRVAACVEWQFNFALLNRYRDGRDRMGWHTDAEHELGPEPVIASVSLGAPRRFALRAHDGRRIALDLANGSLLVMFGGSQSTGRHALPRSMRARGERINVTFRRVLASVE